MARLKKQNYYNLNTSIKLMETHKQFQGGLKTVDTDDSLDSFYLRDAENISLSEFGFIERRYGLVNDYNFDFLALQESVNTTSSKYRLQGYFEYLRSDGRKDQIIFFNGYLYLNGTRVNALYKYDEENFGPSISDLNFDDYIANNFPDSDYESLSNIQNLFLTNREIEATRIENRLFIFTGVYPIIYEGTGEFFLMPEHRTTFAELRASGHDLHSKNLSGIYAAGKLPEDTTAVASAITVPAFGDIGYQPLLPYNIGDGSGLTLKTKFTIPDSALYQTTFAGFTKNGVRNVGQTYIDGAVNYQNKDGIYLEMFPEVYYRASGLTAEDIGWTKLEDSVLEYQMFSNLGTENRNSDLFTLFVAAEDLQSSDVVEAPFAPGINIVRALDSKKFATTANQEFNIKIVNVPIGYNDYLVVLNFRKFGYEDRGVSNDFNETFISEIVYPQTYTLDNVFGSNIPVEDYNEFKAETLWSCNKVLNHYGKLMVYGSLDIPQRLFIGSPTYKNYFPSYFTLDFQTDDEQVIQQITPFMNILVVQSESFTWGLKGIDALIESENTYTPFTISPIYGTIAPKSVRPVRNQLYFLSKEGIVSLQSLYAIDDQYNVKRMDENIENIVPQDPEAVAIQYDNQYWINFPNTDNNLTLRYDVDLRAWMKDTYFEYNGLNNQNQPVKSQTVFNGIFKYIRENENLVLITNPMQLANVDQNVFGADNFKVYRLYVDYSIPTDLKETPRTLFETSFLNQGYPFHTKKYLEEKMEFTIQNEYNKGLEPLLVDRNVDTEEFEDPEGLNDDLHYYDIPQIPIEKNHDYTIELTDSSDDEVEIRRIQIALFDIQGNPVLDKAGIPIVLNYEDNIPIRPTIHNFVVNENTVQFEIYNNDSQAVQTEYAINEGEIFQIEGTSVQFKATVGPIAAFGEREVTLSNVPTGYHRLTLVSKRVGSNVLSAIRTIYFYVPDGIAEVDGEQPGIVDTTSLPPNGLRGTVGTGIYLNPVTQQNETYADEFNLVWNDSNLEDGVTSTSFTMQYRNVTKNGSFINLPEITTLPTEANPYSVSFNESQVIEFKNDLYEFRIRANFKGKDSVYSSPFQIRLSAPAGAPDDIEDLKYNDVVPDRIQFYWTDVEGEDYYRVYWRYKNENYTTLAQYIPTSSRQLLVDQETGGTVRFYLEALDPDESEQYPELENIYSNAIVEVLIIPVNSTNVNTIDINSGVKLEGIYRRAYDHTQIIREPQNGVSGIKITNPAAKKSGTDHGPTPGPTVFESFWDFTFAKLPNSANDLWSYRVGATNGVTYLQAEEPTSPSGGQTWAQELPNGELRVYEYDSLASEWVLFGARVLPESNKEIAILDQLDPETQYNIRLRGVYDVEGALQNDALVEGYWTPSFSGTSGNVTFAQAAAPSFVSESVAAGSITVRVKNNQGTSADLYWNIRTTNTPIDLNNSSTYTRIQNLANNAEVNLSINTNEQTTYYLNVVAKNDTTTVSQPLTRTFTTPAFCTAGYTGATRCPLGDGVAPYTLEREYRTGVWNGSACVTEWQFVQNNSSICGYTAPQTFTVTYYWSEAGTLPVPTYTTRQVESGEYAPNLDPGGSFGYWDPDITTTVITGPTEFYGVAEVVQDPVPSAPSSASITSTGTNQVTFTWSSVSGATYYQYTYYLGGSAGGSGNCSLPSETISVPAGSVYVRVRACNSSGCSTGYAQTQTVTVSGLA